VDDRPHSQLEQIVPAVQIGDHVGLGHRCAGMPMTTPFRRQRAIMLIAEEYLGGNSSRTAHSRARQPSSALRSNSIRCARACDEAAVTSPSRRGFDAFKGPCGYFG
jgi:hypothetical protein